MKATTCILLKKGQFTFFYCLAGIIFCRVVIFTEMFDVNICPYNVPINFNLCEKDTAPYKMRNGPDQYQTR